MKQSTPALMVYETKLFLCALDGEQQDLNITLYCKATDIEALRRQLPKLAELPLKTYGTQLVFVTNEVKPKPFLFDPSFWKGKTA